MSDGKRGILKVWKDADPGITEVEDARKRFARLSCNPELQPIVENMKGQLGMLKHQNIDK